MAVCWSTGLTRRRCLARTDQPGVEWWQGLRVPDVTIAEADPRADDVAALIATHLGLMRAVTPPESVYALDGAGLQAAGVTLFTARQAGALLGIAAIRAMDCAAGGAAGGAAGEVKSMHVRQAARGRGIGERLVAHLIAVARGRSYGWLYLETGPGAAHAAARRLYARQGFVDCGPFGDYRTGPDSGFMRCEIAGRGDTA